MESPIIFLPIPELSSLVSCLSLREPFLVRNFYQGQCTPTNEGINWTLQQLHNRTTTIICGWTLESFRHILSAVDVLIQCRSAQIYQTSAIKARFYYTTVLSIQHSTSQQSYWLTRQRQYLHMHYKPSTTARDDSAPRRTKANERVRAKMGGRSWSRSL